MCVCMFDPQTLNGDGPDPGRARDQAAVCDVAARGGGASAGEGGRVSECVMCVRVFVGVTERH